MIVLETRVERARLHLRIRGLVQGVGFRPHVHRLAAHLGLAGWVRNGVAGVEVEVEGAPDAVEAFSRRVRTEAPPNSRLDRMEAAWVEVRGEGTFEIRESDGVHSSEGSVSLGPDLAPCPECRREIQDPGNRRYRYPFTNCTRCGPRYTIALELPFDRERTSMRGFRMCSKCRAEYEDPHDRRFHAQPNACPDCGPRVAFRLATGESVAVGDAALREVVSRLCAGQVIAVKGLGGYQLWTPAHDEGAVRRLRDRKHRPTKPLAVMYPSLKDVRRICWITPEEERLLTSPEAPIVLLHRLPWDAEPGAGVPALSVAGSNPWLGVMLASTPLHHVLLGDLGFAVVATSGNLGDEPICFDDAEARARLAEVADGFLEHDRTIVRPVDDSVVRVIGGRPMVLRRARGYVPLGISLDGVCGDPAAGGEKRRRVLGVGGHQKSTVAYSNGSEVFVGPHLGDLENAGVVVALRRCVADLDGLFGMEPQCAAADGHPGYESSRVARQSGLPVTRVQHHHAHVLACLAENGEPPPVLGVVWDGTGDGMDGTVWGGEFLRVTARGSERFARMRRFRLPGGDAAVREPRRSALGLLHELFGSAVMHRRDLAPVREFNEGELSVLERMLDRGTQSPQTSSAGRLIDAVSSLLGLRQVNGFEGDAAMAVEHAADGMEGGGTYVFSLIHLEGAGGDKPVYEVDWGPMICELLLDLDRGGEVGEIAARFMETLAEIAVSVAGLAGEERVVLSGGCFQSRRLTESVLHRLRRAGLRPIWHRWIPPNDGGIALGQVVAASLNQG